MMQARAGFCFKNWTYHIPPLEMGASEDLSKELTFNLGCFPATSGRSWCVKGRFGPYFHSITHRFSKKKDRLVFLSTKRKTLFLKHTGPNWNFSEWFRLVLLLLFAAASAGTVFLTPRYALGQRTTRKYGQHSAVRSPRSRPAESPDSHSQTHTHTRAHVGNETRCGVRERGVCAGVVADQEPRWKETLTLKTLDLY